MNAPNRYTSTHPVRLVTAASLFDGHDAAINIMRRILQASGAEVIHLGHNRSVAEIVDCAIQEDVQGIALTSYQGGHVEYLKYMYDMLKERKANIRIFAGGGGTILPSEIAELHEYGIDRIYSPDDGRELGLQGMIDDLLSKADFATVRPDALPGLLERAGRTDHAGALSFFQLAPGRALAVDEGLPTHRLQPAIGCVGGHALLLEIVKCKFDAALAEPDAGLFHRVAIGDAVECDHSQILARCPNLNPFEHDLTRAVPTY